MTSAVSKTELFLDLYKTLEARVSAVYGDDVRGSEVTWLSNRREFRHLRDELDYCREVRNILSHNPKVDGDFLVEPSDKMIKLLEDIIREVDSPARIDEVMIHRNQVLACSLDDLVKPALAKMLQSSFTHIPILDDGRVCGVFSEKTLLTCMVDKAFAAGSDLTFADIKKYLALENRGYESFRFIAHDLTVSDAGKMFSDAIRKKDRIGMIFVTHGGKPTERLMGIVTAWDVAAHV